MGVQSILFNAGCKYYNWRNGARIDKRESGSSDTQGLQNPEEGGSTSRIRHEEPLIPKIWQAESGEQMILPFKPSRFREPPVRRLKYAGYYEPALMGKNTYGYRATSASTFMCSSAAQGGYWSEFPPNQYDIKSTL
jgi:hypothetical protein